MYSWVGEGSIDKQKWDRWNALGFVATIHGRAEENSEKRE